METKIESDDKKSENFFENILENNVGINPYAAVLFKYNFDFFNKLYMDFSETMANYYKNQIEVFEKLVEINKPCCDIASEKATCTNESPCGDKKNNTDILPASGHDICNYLAGYGMINSQIQAIMEFDGRLDFDKLKRAVRLSVDAEPVFACRFIEDDPPYWKRMDNIDEDILCTIEETDDSYEAVMGFLRSPLDMDTDLNVKVKLIRSDQSDILGVKINHACCDGEGIKGYIKLLSYIYSCIDQENGTFTPEIGVGSRKDRDSLFKELSMMHPELKWNPLSEMPKTMWPFLWKQRGENSVSFSLCRLHKRSLELIYQYAKSKGATVNDLILTAFYRVMFRISNPAYRIPMDISSTIDLRRYIPENEAQAARNLSGGFIIKLARKKNEPFDHTLARVMNETKKIKEGLQGLNDAVDGENVEKVSFTYYNNYFKPMFQMSQTEEHSTDSICNIAYPGISDLGYISSSLIKFGENAVTDAFIIPPAVCAPGFQLLISAYNDILTFSTGYYTGSIPQGDMHRILIMVRKELMRGCMEEV